MRVELRRTSWDDPDAIDLRDRQSREIGRLYASEPTAEHRDDSEVIDESTVLTTVLAYAAGEAIGHAALRRLGDDVEIKRMFVVPERRRTGLAAALLAELEQTARDVGAPRIILHTGEKQAAALGFYRRHGYTPIPVYPPYEAVAYSVCFEKVL